MALYRDATGLYGPTLYGRPKSPEATAWDGIPSRASSLTVTVIDHAIHDGQIAAAVRIETIGVLCGILALREPADVEVVEDDVAGVGHEVVVLRAVPEDEIRDDAVLETVDADQHGPQRVDVGRVRVVPYLSVAVECATCGVSVPASQGSILRFVSAGLIFAGQTVGVS